MNIDEYDMIQNFCKHKLNQKQNIKSLSSKYQEGYEDGIKAVMSFLHSEKEWHNLIKE